jgi:hypothetical protein
MRNRARPELGIENIHFQNLITYNMPINDQIITTVCEGMCTTYQISYLSTKFVNHIAEFGWNRVSKYFASNKRAHRRSINRPYKHGEPVVLIPTFIHGNHWIGLVRREINKKIVFLYADDMNNNTTENQIKQLIFHHTDSEFCPLNAEWIHCKGNHYHPHSNECGPRTIVALYILALHPSPHENMLLPVMHPNLAQIARTWVATQIINGMPKINGIEPFLSIETCLDSRQTNRAPSSPFDLIPWTTQADINDAPYPSIQPLEQDKWPTKSQHNLSSTSSQVSVYSTTQNEVQPNANTSDEYNKYNQLQS